MPRKPLYDVFDNGTPSTATAGASSGVALAKNPLRRYAIIYNLGTVNVFLAVNHAAVSGQGILIQPNGGWYELTDANLSHQVINCIAASSTAVLSILEGT